jgi:autoinducer 2-degrading protein
VSAGAFVVVVEFAIRPAHADAFREAMVENARRSLDAEPGCVQFDVCVDPGDPARVFLYERYVDEAAFRAHLAAAHFLAFDRLTAPWVQDKAVRTLRRIETT